MLLAKPDSVIALGVAAILAGCTMAGSGAERASLADEVGCYNAIDPLKCKIDHSLAGGHAIQVIGTDP
jgi:hypothetical protein